MKKNLILPILISLLCLQSAIAQRAGNKDVIDIDDDDLTFDQFKNKFGKNYKNSEEVSSRKANFEKNVKRLKESGCTACGVTNYFDLSDAQLQQKRGLKQVYFPFDQSLIDLKSLVDQKSDGKGLRAQTAKDNGTIVNQEETQVKSKAQSGSTGSQTVSAFSTTILDWRNSNMVTPVRDQGSCGSCWAFATVAFLESQLIRTQQATNTVDLSEQYVLKCDTSSGGCNGGNCISSTQLAISTGLPVESDYPYSPYTTTAGICSATPDYTFNTPNFSYYYSSTKMRDSAIISYLNVRPLIIYVSASSWYMYRPTSTSRTFSCSRSESTRTSNLNHAVLLVGYTSTEWIVKNSWGQSWGSSGYIFISRSSSANCGIGFFIASFA